MKMHHSQSACRAIPSKLRCIFQCSAKVSKHNPCANVTKQYQCALEDLQKEIQVVPASGNPRVLPLHSNVVLFSVYSISQLSSLTYCTVQRHVC